MVARITLEEWEKDNLLLDPPKLGQKRTFFGIGDLITPSRPYVQAFRPGAFYDKKPDGLYRNETLVLEDQSISMALSYPWPYMSDEPVKILVGEEIWYVDGGDMSKSPRMKENG